MLSDLGHKSLENAQYIIGRRRTPVRSTENLCYGRSTVHGAAILSMSDLENRAQTLEAS